MLLIGLLGNDNFFITILNEEFFSSSLLQSIPFLLCYLGLGYGLKFWFRRLSSDIPLVTLNILQTPILAILGLSFLKSFLSDVAVEIDLSWFNRVINATITLIITYCLAQLTTQVLAQYLKDYAEESERMWDDVIIPILEVASPVIIYGFGAFLSLQALGIDLTGIWVAIGGITFVLGFALQNILSNFFSGLVLLIDTPFQFGDVISLPDNSLALIKKIGLRVTELYLIETHCEIYMPNSKLQEENIINLSRPTSHYYYSIKITTRTDSNPLRAVELMREVILAHPDTLGNLEDKLELIDRYYDIFQDEDNKPSKKETGKARLLAESKLIHRLREIDQRLHNFTTKIKELEKDGINREELRWIKGTYLDIAKAIGLELPDKSKSKIKNKFQLLEINTLEDENKIIDQDESLIQLVRNWYQAWLDDPYLIEEDEQILITEWERKINYLKIRTNKIYQTLNKPSQETRIDNEIEELIDWMQTKFKHYHTQWQDPKIMLSDVSESGREYQIKFYADDIKLEHCERGNRVTSQVRRELARQLRQAYL